MRRTLIKKKIEDFRNALIRGIEGIVRAAEIYVEAIDEDPTCSDQFRDACADWIPASAWAQFEAVGRKWMHPRLIMGGMADRRKAALVKQLPYSMQERIFDHERFPLLVAKGEQIKVDIFEATRSQAEQLCNGSSIRNLSEQKAWLESQAVVESAKPEPMPYIVCGGKITFRRGVTLTRPELKRILQEM